MDYQQNNQDRRRDMCSNYICMAHVIRTGDTLYRLSREYGVKMSALMMANPFVDVYNLRVGDELCIPRVRQAADRNDMPMPRTNPNTDMNRMQQQPEMSARSNESVMQPENTADERVIDAEMNMMHENKEYSI